MAEQPKPEKVEKVEKAEEVTVTRDWNKPDIFHIPEERKRKDRAYRFCSKRDGNMENKKQQGWNRVEVDAQGKPFNDMDTHDLMLCEMPIEKKNSRDKYYEEKNIKQEAAVRNELAQAGRQAGMETYQCDHGHFGKKKSFAMGHNPIGRQH